MKRRVVEASRRFVNVYDSQNVTIESGRTSSRTIDACVGDIVECENSKEGLVINAIVERKNCLIRSYGRKSKQLVANLDHLFIVTAPKPLFNSVFIDRILVACAEQEIPCTLIVNKSDLEENLEETKDTISVYENLVSDILYTCALNGTGVDTLAGKFNDGLVFAFAGISGVGKTSLLNSLLPESKAKTGEVSSKTGQGKQTTSEALAYAYGETKPEQTFIVDLPGIQNYGLSHIDEQNLRLYYPEFEKYDQNCKFSDCKHINEPDCAVLEAVSKGEISRFRHDSYKEILEEIQSFTHY